MTGLDEPSAVLEQMTTALVGVRCASLPGATVAAIKARILDTVGVSIGASDQAGSERAFELAAVTSNAADATVIGRQDQLSAPEAAFVNGVLAHTLDFDDTHLPSIAHPSSTILPTVLAVAEALDASGADLIAAAAVGYEVSIRAAMGGYDPASKTSIFFERGWHATSICGALGAAAAAAHLLGLGVARTGHAIGIAASLGSGILEANRSGGTVKQLHCGWAAKAGIFAAQAAHKGFTGPPTVFEGRFGFYSAFCGSLPNPAALTSGLGERWAVDEVVTKPFPTNHFTHSAIEAARSLKARLDGSEIVAIEVLAPGPTLRTIAQPQERKAAPDTPYNAKFSAPFLVAMALAGHGSGLGITQADLTAERLADPEVLHLASLVTCRADDRVDAIFPTELPAIVRVATRDGADLEEAVLTTLGGPSRPLTVDQLRLKFDTNVVPIIGEAQGSELWDVASNLESLSARDLGTALRRGVLRQSDRHP